MFVYALTFAALVVILGYIFSPVCKPPSNFPSEIPTVPFYVGILSLIWDIDQLELYYRYLEQPMKQYGAVKYYFAGRWNILIGNAELLQDLFKREEVFQKSGNQKKIPHSILAHYTGDNIISAHGDVWQQYAKVMKPGLQQAPAAEPTLRNTQKLLALIASAAEDGPVAVGPLIQRYALACLAQTFLGVDFGTLDDPNNRFHRMQMALKRAIFKPVFMTFPVLDQLPFTGRDEVRLMVDGFHNELRRIILEKFEGLECSIASTLLSERMVAALRTGVWTSRQFKDNLLITFVAGHENPQIMATSVLYLLGKHINIQESLRAEMEACTPQGCETIDRDVLKSCPLLMSVIYEAVRLMPPLSQLVNRRVDEACMLGGRIHIPAGAYLGYHCYAVCQDKQYWGEDAATFRPARWGSTAAEIHARYRFAKSKALLPTFHGGRRSCLGESFAIFQLQILLWSMIRAFRWSLDPNWTPKMTPAGPLFPAGLRLLFEKV